MRGGEGAASAFWLASYVADCLRDGSKRFPLKCAAQLSLRTACRIRFIARDIPGLTFVRFRFCCFESVAANSWLSFAGAEGACHVFHPFLGNFKQLSASCAWNVACHLFVGRDFNFASLLNGSNFITRPWIAPA
eukprot:scaffold42372_cov17-Tisochrysis_lutea.AAC.1